MQALLNLDQILLTLRGKILCWEESRLNRDDSGRSSYSEKVQKLMLYPDNTFRFEQTTSVSISSSRLKGPIDPVQATTGNWAVERTQDKIMLVLQTSEGSVFIRWYIEADESGLQYLDCRTWRCYLMR